MPPTLPTGWHLTADGQARAVFTGPGRSDAARLRRLLASYGAAYGAAVRSLPQVDGEAPAIEILLSLDRPAAPSPGELNLARDLTQFAWEGGWGVNEA